MKKGFTLIELLAVIVILAIIALIAVPIVLNIIGDSKDKSLVRSAENYIEAVKQGIANYQLNHPSDELNPKYCTSIEASVERLKCYNEDNTDIPVDVKIDGEKPREVKIKFSNGKVLKINDTYLVYNKIDKIYYDQNGNMVKGIYKNEPLCVFADEGEEEGKRGAKYNCKVNDSNTFEFYISRVENSNGEDVNNYFTEDKTPAIYKMVLGSDICENGLLDINNECGSVWVSESDYNSYAVGKGVGYGNAGYVDKGPITAMKYLYNATKDWNNVPTLKLSYDDKCVNYLGGGRGNHPYGGIFTNGATTTITMEDGTVTASFEDMKAVLPSFYDLYKPSKSTASSSDWAWTYETCGTSSCELPEYGNGNAVWTIGPSAQDNSKISNIQKIRPVITVLPSNLGLE